MSEEKKVSEQEAKQQDLDRRIKGFNEELSPLLGKYNLSLGSIAFVTPDGRIASQPHLFDADQVKKADQGTQLAEG